MLASLPALKVSFASLVRDTDFAREAIGIVIGAFWVIGIRIVIVRVGVSVGIVAPVTGIRYAGGYGENHTQRKKIPEAHAVSSTHGLHRACAGQTPEEGTDPQ